MNYWCQNQVLYNILIFVTWTVTSFLCHNLGKVFITSFTTLLSHEGESTILGNDVTTAQLTSSLILTSVQLLICYVCITLGDTHRSDTKTTTIKLCHALATLATNTSMAFMFASSTFAIKMMEPVTSAVVQYLMVGSPLTPLAVTSLPIIVGGAIVFAGNPFDMSNTFVGMVVAFLSNIILAVRNIALKQMPSGEDSQFKPRLRGNNFLTPCTMLMMVLSLSLFLEVSDILPSKTTERFLYVALSGLFHAIYSYVSTALVLTKISVVSHAVANILKRLLVVLLLYIFSQRSGTLWNFMGLLACTVGLLIYTWDKTGSYTRVTHEDVRRDDNARSKSIITYLKNGFIVLGVMGIISFLSPRLDLPIEALPRNESSNALHHLHATRSKLDMLDIGKMKRPHDLQLLPNLEDFPETMRQTIQDFLNPSLHKHPGEVNFLSEKLKTSDEIIKESQRLHFNVLGKELEHFKYAILFDIAAFENKGDPCITAGEIYFLARMNIELIYYCNAHGCKDDQLEKARKLAGNYSVQELVILVHGGGNIIGYAVNDLLRFKIIKLFSSFQMMVFPQSVWIRTPNHPHITRTVNNYCCNSNLTIVLRDALSYRIARQLYNGTTRLLMAPDMAFQIGKVSRFMSPVFDIMWIKRKDGETPGYNLPKVTPKNIKVHISDWWKWSTPRASTSLEKAFYVTTNGFFFLQRGRVVITDRLHGHIMSVLMDIPHVLIDNKAKKLSSYHNSWTRSLNNTVITDDPSKALHLAMELLKKYNDTLPPVVPYLNLREDFSKPLLGVPDSRFP